jgi:polysaccharide biosynthesis/export protein
MKISRMSIVCAISLWLVAAIWRGEAAVSAQTPGALAEVSTPSTQLQNRNPRYQLRKSDTFELEFSLSPEFTQSISVQPDGYITLKSVGTIYVEGLTIPELTEHIQQAYSKILQDPVITIELKDFDKPYFIVSGQIGKPGKYDLRSDLTVTQGVAVAGGFTDASQRAQVVLFRSVGNGMSEARVINIKKMLNARDLAEDIHLQPGDMIYVPQNVISKIQKYLPTSSLGLYSPPIF